MRKHTRDTHACVLVCVHAALTSGQTTYRHKRISSFQGRCPATHGPHSRGPMAETRRWLHDGCVVPSPRPNPADGSSPPTPASCGFPLPPPLHSHSHTHINGQSVHQKINKETVALNDGPDQIDLADMLRTWNVLQNRSRVRPQNTSQQVSKKINESHKKDFAECFGALANRVTNRFAVSLRLTQPTRTALSLPARTNPCHCRRGLASGGSLSSLLV